MYDPCFECYNRYGHYYTEECDNTCDYANTVAERNKIIDYLLDMLEEEHIGLRCQGVQDIKNNFGIEF